MSIRRVFLIWKCLTPLLPWLKWGQATIVTPFTLMGAMAPVSFPAALSQQNAEALFVIAMIQSVYPGAPVVYGGFTSNVDMKTGHLHSAHLKMPLPILPQVASYAGIMDCHIEAVVAVPLISLMLKLLLKPRCHYGRPYFGGANMIYHAAGWMEGGLVASMKKLCLMVI